jgi:acetoin utilization deacetylase AcuC-like enzyme
MYVYWNDDYTASEYAFDTTRKSRAIVERLEREPIGDLIIKDPMSNFLVEGTEWESSFDEVAIEHLQKIHTPEYFEAVRTGKPGALARSQGFKWDSGIFTMAVAHTTGLIAATHHALSNKTQAGSLSSGLHHARANTGCGYCTFNGLAATVSYAVNTWGLKKILVLDLDAHGGGGTDEIIATHFADHVVHADVISSVFDKYPVRKGNYFKQASIHGYSPQTEMFVQRIFSQETFDLVIYNAGMDPINTGVSLQDIEEREKMVRFYIGDTPAVFALAGGYTWGEYTMDDVVDWHLLTLKTWEEYDKVKK